jgi:hypothetical protein
MERSAYKVGQRCMSLELWNLAASFGTFLVILVTAIAATLELKHMQARNSLQAVLTLQREFRDPEIQESLRYVQSYLPQKIRDPQYRAELAEIGFIDSRVHMEMTACNFFNQMGTLVKNDIVDADAFLDQTHRIIDQYWKLLSPIIAILRRRRGDEQYQNFEYLAALSQEWRKKHPTGIYPRGVPRMPLDDVWLVEDQVVGKQPMPIST